MGKILGKKTGWGEEWESLHKLDSISTIINCMKQKTKVLLNIDYIFLGVFTSYV